jgi:signal transduction histidine kinase
VSKPSSKRSGSPKPEGVIDEPVRFVADARLISVLGEQLIGSEKVGILELVKNAYDAGATSCVVTLDGVPGLEPTDRQLPEYAALDGPVIEIRDDGSGMSREDIVEGWLRPATVRRARVKEQLKAERAAAAERGTLKAYNALVARLKDAHGGRLPLGEKGIGRLATHRLGRFLWLRTKIADEPFEWELRIDWNAFDAGGEQRDLDAVELQLRRQPPTTNYGKKGSGTVLCCYGGRPGYAWTAEAIIDAGRAVNALRSPWKAPSRFSPTFVSSQVDEDALGSPLDRVRAPFELTAIVDAAGTADIEVIFDPPSTLSVEMKRSRHEERKDLRLGIAKAWAAPSTESDPAAPTAPRSPACGPFSVHIRSWIRDREWLGVDFKELTQYLDNFGGLTVYRDGLAAMPASAKSDWLGIAMRQIKKSSSISYYHMAGEVELAQESNLELRDRSSREGMIETQAYRDLVLLTRSVVDELQFHMQSARKAWSDLRTESEPPPEPEVVKKDSELLASVIAALAEGYDFRKDPLKIAKIAGGKERAGELLEAAAKRVRSVGDHAVLQEEERDGLLEAAGFGLAIGVGTHEMSKLASAIVSDVRRLKTSKGREPLFSETSDAIQRRAEALLSEIRRLAPLRVTRTEGSRTFSIRSAVEAARSAFSFAMEESQILSQIDGGDFKVTGRFGALTQVFANLFDNALYWISARGGGGAIQVVLSRESRTLVFGDSGPGITDKMKSHLFEPFYSEKSPPSGLGLYICKYYLGQIGASIRLARSSERTRLGGAHFLIDFSRSAGEGAEE